MVAVLQVNSTVNVISAVWSEKCGLTPWHCFEKSKRFVFATVPFSGDLLKEFVKLHNYLGVRREWNLYSRSLLHHI